MWLLSSSLLLLTSTPSLESSTLPSGSELAEATRVAPQEPGEESASQESGLPPWGDAELHAALAAEMEEYDLLSRRYENDKWGYQLELVELGRQRVRIPKNERPPHPALAYKLEYENLAAAGNGAARMWLVTQSGLFIEGPNERAAYMRDLLPTTARENPNGEYWLDGLDVVFQQRRQIGVGFLVDVMHLLQEASVSPPIIAKAYFTEAELLLSNKERTDPEQREKAQAIWRILVDGYPHTKPGRFAGAQLLNPLVRDMRADQLEWLTTARELRDQGQPPEAWPPLPLFDYETRLQAIATTGHDGAEEWVERILPAFEQASREGVDDALIYLANWCSRSKGHDDVEWKALKFDLLDFIFTTFPDEPRLTKALDVLSAWVPVNDPEDYVPILDELLRNTSDELIAFQARLLKGTILLKATTSVELEQGLALLDEVAAGSPDDVHRSLARERAQTFRWTMPGAVHPTLNLRDTERVLFSTMDYQGQILFMYFWSARMDGDLEDLAWVNELHKRYEDSPVSVLGLNVDMNTINTFKKVANKHGITWRNALVQARQAVPPMEYQVLRYPTSFVIDADGVIRGRALSHEDTDALIQSLLGEMGARVPTQPMLGPRGTLKGVVSFDGDLARLPDLEATDEQRAECSAPDRALDLSDRSRLVSSEGGLANVAIIVDVPKGQLSGVNPTAVINQRYCRFEPHTLLVTPGTSLWIRNSDSMVRTVAASSEHNKDFQILQGPGDQYRSVLEHPDRFEVTSPSHPWMSCWVVVTDSDFSALSAEDGSFEIPDLPEGTYRARWWHESLGEGESVEFTIEANQATRLELTIPG